MGFELQSRSWGYLLERGAALGVPVEALLSRCPLRRSLREQRSGKDTYGAQHTSGVHVCGREVLNVWRLCRGEVKLQDYSFPSVCGKVLGRRVPAYSYRSLHVWFEGAGSARPPPATEHGGAGAPAPSAAAPMPAPCGAAEGAGAAGAAGRFRNRRRVLRHLLGRAADTLQLLDAIQLVDRTCDAPPIPAVSHTHRFP